MKNLLLNELYLELANHLKWMPSETRKLISISITKTKGNIVVITRRDISVLIDKDPIINYFISKSYQQIPNWKEEDYRIYQWKLSFKRNDN
jgi:hypothetical protein